jgi:hypothetical protein
MKNLEPPQHQPSLETDLVEVEEQVPALEGFQGLFVGGAAGPVLVVVLVEPLTVIGSDPPVEFGFDHVSDGLGVTVPLLNSADTGGLLNLDRPVLATEVSSAPRGRLTTVAATGTFPPF